MEIAAIPQWTANARRWEAFPVEERLRPIGADLRAWLSHLAILNEAVPLEEASSFLEICGFTLPDESFSALLQCSLEHALLTASHSEAAGAPVFICIESAARKKLLAGLSTEETRHRHACADQFYERVYAQALSSVLPPGQARQITPTALRELVIQPGGLIEAGAQNTRRPDFQQWNVQRAYHWQEHLFQLEKYGEAELITNSICFPMARMGFRNQAKDLLARNAGANQGLPRATAQINLATLLADECSLQDAAALYHQAVGTLIHERAWDLLASAFIGISIIHREKGELLTALLYQELSLWINTWQKNPRGQAAAHNQLAILYRALKLKWIGLRHSQSAMRFWREAQDDVNLAKTLITRGNLYYQMRKPKQALQCYDESLGLCQKLGMLGDMAGSLSGQARSWIQLKEYDKARELLNQAIALRKRCRDHHVGVEYENLGFLYEQQGNLRIALGWYQKALGLFEKYQPALVDTCQLKIQRIEERL